MKWALIRTNAFARAAKAFLKDHPHDRDSLVCTLELLAVDPFSPQLRTHKLKGKLAGCWACSGGYDLRIVFEMDAQDEVRNIVLLSVGTHDEVY